MLHFDDLLLEHGFARVMRILWGDVPNVKHVGIMTAENPNGQLLPPAQNEQRNRKLYSDLRCSNFGPIKIKGKFVANPAIKLEDVPEENSFLIPHISRDTLLAFATTRDQLAAIWGQKKSDANGNPYFDFEWIDCHTGLTTQHRYVVMTGEEIQGRKDAYSKSREESSLSRFGPILKGISCRV